MKELTCKKAGDEVIWECKIGGIAAVDLPNGCDAPMRMAVEREFKRLTGAEEDFTFSGWGASLTEEERAAYENRLPDLELQIRQCEDRLNMLLSYREELKATEDGE
jgi:hypothetical protein